MVDLFVFLAFFCIVGLTTIVLKYSHNRMIKIEFEKNGQETITIWTDPDGVVQKADRNRQYWREQVVVKPLLLEADDTMKVYNIYTDSVDQNKYRVIKIERED